MKPSFKLALFLSLLLGCSIDNSLDPQDALLVRRIHIVREIEAAYGTYVGPAKAHQYAWLTLTNAEQNDLPPLLIAAVAIEESHLKERAKGKAGEIGLMQVHPHYWRGHFPECGKNLWVPKTNFCYGAKILNVLGISGYNGRSSETDTVYSVKIYARLGKLYLLLHTFFHDYI